MYTNPFSTLLVYLHIYASGRHTHNSMLSKLRYFSSNIVPTPTVESLTKARGTSLLQLGFSCGSTHLHFYTPWSAPVQCKTVMLQYQCGCSGWSLLQGPPHRSSHGRNGGLPGVTPHPYSHVYPLFLVSLGFSLWQLQFRSFIAPFLSHQVLPRFTCTPPFSLYLSYPIVLQNQKRRRVPLRATN